MTINGGRDLQTMPIEERKELYNAIVNPTHKLKEEVNKEITVVGVYAEVSETLNSDTGEMESGHRIVLMADNGESYSTHSVGVFTSLKTICTLFGTPSKQNKLTVIAKQRSTKGGKNVLTLEMI